MWIGGDEGEDGVLGFVGDEDEGCEEVGGLAFFYR